MQLPYQDVVTPSTKIRYAIIDLGFVTNQLSTIVISNGGKVEGRFLEKSQSISRIEYRPGLYGG
jgi:hypothetical protein